MNKHPKQLALGLLGMGVGNHVAGWRHPQARADGTHDIDFFIELARTAERARFDMLFFADSLAIRERGGPESFSRSHHIGQLEPLTALAAIAVCTERLGLVATASTTYNEPYHVARKFASLDHISKGRAGWNAVTSFTQSEALNFGLEAHPDHAARYARAREFVDVVRGLWDSWDDGVYVRDKETGVHIDPARLHALNHRGDHFRVRGPLNVERPPQGHPVMVQAGASADGQRLAAATAELVFSAAESITHALAFNESLRAQASNAGRDPELLKIMPGAFVVVAETESQAREQHQELQELIHPAIGVAQLSSMIGFDLSGHALDGPLPDLGQTQGHQSRQQLLVALARREGWTIRQLYQYVANGFGHRVMVGSADQVADEMQAWFEQGAADGFNVLPPYLPGGFDAFCQLVVPRLQRRGLFRTEYAGRTLRDHLGLAAPGPLRKRAPVTQAEAVA